MKSVSVGDVFYDVTRYKMGNTMVTTTDVYRVVVTEVHENYFMASWNDNPPRKYYAVQASWRRSKPFLKKSGWAMYPASKAERYGDGVTVVEMSTYFLVKHEEKKRSIAL